MTQAREWIYFNEDGTPFLRVLRFDNPKGKSYPQFRWSNNQWQKGSRRGQKFHIACRN